MTVIAIIIIVSNFFICTIEAARSITSMTQQIGSEAVMILIIFFTLTPSGCSGGANVIRGVRAVR